MPPAEESNLESVRSELRRLGYLHHGVERFLLQDALRPRRPGRTLLRLTLKVALLAGSALALAAALALAVANGALTVAPLDLPVLFLHLFPPVSAAVALAFLAVCGILLLVLKLYHVRHVETLSLALALGVGAGALALAVQGARGVLVEIGRGQLLLLGVVAPLAVYLLIKLVHHGLLSLTIQLTREAPRNRLFSRRWLGLAILAAAFLVTLPAVLSARRGAPAAPPALPTAAGERVLLLGLDGVLPEELDYLLARGELPAMAALLRSGGELWAYGRQPEPPASFWTEVATGLPTPDHGVTSLDSFLPFGAETPLARNGPLRAWWSRAAVPLGLAEYRPILANRRRAYTVWELAARGGAPVLAVNWWGTFPAESLPGLVAAHGAYQLLQGEARGAVAPEAERAELAGLAAEASRLGVEELAPGLSAALPRGEVSGLLEHALRPDRFYRELFARRLAGEPRAAALYLPALDIAADGWQGGAVAFADVVRAELGAADRLLGASLEGVGTVAVVLDPGRRREAGAGRVLFWRRGGCAEPGTAGVTGAGEAAARGLPEAVASGLLRALGLPQSRELPPPPGACGWREPPAVVAGYGEPRHGSSGTVRGREYLESLRSLGYL